MNCILCLFYYIFHIVFFYYFIFLLKFILLFIYTHLSNQPTINQPTFPTLFFFFVENKKKLKNFKQKLKNNKKKVTHIIVNIFTCYICYIIGATFLFQYTHTYIYSFHIYLTFFFTCCIYSVTF